MEIYFNFTLGVEKREIQIYPLEGGGGHIKFFLEIETEMFKYPLPPLKMINLI